MESVLVIGYGIAGCLLSDFLKKRGVDVYVANQRREQTSSGAAAWLMNPVTGLRFSRAWGFDEMLPVAKEYYETAGKKWGRSLWRNVPMLRLIRDEGEDHYWQRRVRIGNVADITTELSPLPKLDGIRYGSFREVSKGVEIHAAYQADVSYVMEQNQKELLENKRFYEGRVCWEELEFKGEKVEWRGMKFDHVVYCTGYDAEHPWFSFIPWKPAKGESLLLRIPGLTLETALTCGCFLLPMGGELFRCGATYEWEDLRNIPTEGGRGELLRKLDRFLDCESYPCEVMAHRAGVRPIIRDQKPALGRLPENEQVSFFGGMGSRGAMWVPYLAQQFVSYLLDGGELRKEVRLERFLGN